ncbi:ABC transporter substrate-binding protein [Microbaculum marinisediminis]|uniref:ABC transporter substrate-binding protein n=1 Tax=Microbaculum marinisediminis TaxID=2931392 RepID=A0AAW5R4P1_9HYPH|nr:ABC transporter substrate-binding protein [Microbaculum sp. A6E488]MCT8973853.1 ABC transporter substrate-binding protein [Microbaculum sp. A6E488]
MKSRLFGAVAATAILMAAGAHAADPVKVGFMATLEGTYTVLGEDGQRGFEVALKKWGNKAGGRDIEVIVAPTDASPESALRAVRKLVEQDKVDFVIGPLSGSEGIALRDYAKTQPQVTIINGSSGAQETTFVDPAENFFRYNMDGAQWGVGLGDYVYNDKGWKTVASVAEDYSFGYTNFLGFAHEYCKAGGKITERLWVPLGTKDFASIIAALPDDVDAIYLGLGGGDAVNFLNQYQQAGGGDVGLIGGTIMVDGTVLSSKGNAKKQLIGTPSSGPQADTWDDAKWQEYVKAYQDAFPPEKRFPSPSLLATGYYNAADAAFTCLDEVNGDLSDGQEKFRGCLASIELDAPNGKITLDKNRQAIGSNFVFEVVEMPDGNLGTKMVKKVDNVTQTLGVPEDEFRKLGLPSRDIVDCD